MLGHLIHRQGTIIEIEPSPQKLRFRKIDFGPDPIRQMESGVEQPTNRKLMFEKRETQNSWRCCRCRCHRCHRCRRWCELFRFFFSTLSVFEASCEKIKKGWFKLHAKNWCKSLLGWQPSISMHESCLLDEIIAASYRRLLPPSIQSICCLHSEFTQVK